MRIEKLKLCEALIFTIQGCDGFMLSKISLTKEPSRFKICSKYWKYEKNKILP